MRLELPTTGTHTLRGMLSKEDKTKKRRGGAAEGDVIPGPEREAKLYQQSILSSGTACVLQGTKDRYD